MHPGSQCVGKCAVHSDSPEQEADDDHHSGLITIGSTSNPITTLCDSVILILPVAIMWMEGSDKGGGDETDVSAVRGSSHPRLLIR